MAEAGLIVRAPALAVVLAVLAAPALAEPPPVQPPQVPTKVLVPRGGGNASGVDLLLSDVCVDSADQPVRGDPATCPSHRDLRFGEFVPYFRTDRRGGAPTQASVSYPAQAPDGSLVAVKTFDFGGGPNYLFRDYDVYSPRLDGYDLQETNGVFASVMASQDPGGYKSFWTVNCTHEDSWGYWPVNIAPGNDGTFTFMFNYSVDDQSCPSTLGQSLTLWHYYPAFTFTSGKTLPAAVSWHYDSGDAARVNDFELFYNTPQYGGTRWEQWNTTGPVETGADCNGPTTTLTFGRWFYRVGCRDWGWVSDLDVPINPLAAPFGHELVLSKNLLVAGDFAQQTIGPWRHYDAPGVPTYWAFGQEAATGDYLQLVCSGACAGNSVYQDVDASGLHGPLTVRYGSLLRAKSAADAQVYVFMLDAAGNIVDSSHVPASVGTEWGHFDGTFAWDFDRRPVSRLRFAVYPSAGGVVYSLDESYLTPSL